MPPPGFVVLKPPAPPNSGKPPRLNCGRFCWVPLTLKLGSARPDVRRRRLKPMRVSLSRLVVITYVDPRVALVERPSLMAERSGIVNGIFAFSFDRENRPKRFH